MEGVKRTRPILIPFLLVAVLLHGNPLLAAPGHDTGWFQWVCTGEEFKITKIPHMPGHQIIFFLTIGSPIDPKNLLPGMVASVGKLCTSDTQCENTSKAEFWLDEFSKNHEQVLGKYKLDVGSQHLEGTFVLKFKLHHEQPYICE